MKELGRNRAGWYRRRIPIFFAVLILLSSVILVGIFLVRAAENSKQELSNSIAPGMVPMISEKGKKGSQQLTERPESYSVRYPPPSIERMKRQGCVADGLLSEYGRTSKSVKMINDSECYYLHRALETWLEAPDFETAEEIRDQITLSEVVYGMFLAEAIDTKEDYYYPPEERYFDFSKMCKPGSQNAWGEHSCIPSLTKEEYRTYVTHITERAMEVGIQSFLFGQVQMQDQMSSSHMYEVVRHMREYADFLGVDIVIGAQTNDITDSEYLALFDYIEGGVGIDSEGNVEEKPCSSRYLTDDGGWCWALLWHERYALYARNVFVHFDWNGSLNDDMAIFARMPESVRHETLKELHAYFIERDVGFLLPMMATLPQEHSGCYGEKERYYNADNRYSCKDEDVINRILSDS